MTTSNGPPSMQSIGIIIQDGSARRIPEMMRAAARIARNNRRTEILSEQARAIRSAIPDLSEPTGDVRKDRKRRKEIKRLEKRADKYDRQAARIAQKG